MIAGDQPPSELLGRVAPRAPRLPSPDMGSRGNLNDSPAREGLIASERGNPFGDDAPDQAGTLVFIEFGRSGIAVPCLFQSFIHAQPISKGS